MGEPDDQFSGEPVTLRPVTEQRMRAVEQRLGLRPLPAIPDETSRRQPTAFFDYLRELETDRRERDLLLFLDNEDMRGREDERRQIYEEREAQTHQFVSRLAETFKEAMGQFREAIVSNERVIERLDTLEGAIMRVEATQQEQSAHLSRISEEFTQLKTRVITWDERFHKLEKRVTDLESAFWQHARNQKDPSLRSAPSHSVPPSSSKPERE